MTKDHIAVPLPVGLDLHPHPIHGDTFGPHESAAPKVKYFRLVRFYRKKRVPNTQTTLFFTPLAIARI